MMDKVKAEILSWIDAQEFFVQQSDIDDGKLVVDAIELETFIRERILTEQLGECEGKYITQAKVCPECRGAWMGEPAPQFDPLKYHHVTLNCDCEHCENLKAQIAKRKIEEYVKWYGEVDFDLDKWATMDEFINWLDQGGE